MSSRSSPAPTATPISWVSDRHRLLTGEEGRSSSTLTSYQFQKAPQTQNDEQTGEFALLPLEDDFEHECGYDDDGIESVERPVRNRTVRVVVLESERPEGKRDFDEEERRDHGRDHGKDFQPGRGAGSPRSLTVGGQ